MEDLPVYYINGANIKDLTSKELDNLQLVVDECKFQLGTFKYSSGKVYKWMNLLTGEVGYVGSTIQDLKSRRSGHLNYFKVCQEAVWTVYVMGSGGPSKFEMVLIELYPCRSKAELLAREAYWVRTLNPVCNVLLRGVRAPATSDPAQIQAAIETVIEDPVVRDYFSIPILTAENARHLSDQSAIDAKEKLQLERYWFDHEVIRSRSVSELVRADIFNQLDDGAKTQQLLNLWSEENMDAVLGASKVSINPFAELMEDMPSKLRALRELCAELGLANSHDTSATFSDELLDTNHTTIDSKVKDLMHYLKINRQSTAKKPAAALKARIGYILSNFAGVSIKHRGDP